MGRHSVDKKRTQNPAKQRKFVERVLPLFMEKGIKDLTMDEVAEYLGKSKATIYKYFPGRKDMIQMGLELKLGEIRGFVPMLTNQEDEFLERYRKAIGHFSRAVSDISVIFLADLKAVFPDLWRQVEFFQEFASGIIREFYAEGVSKGLLKPIHPAILVMSDRFLFEVLSDPEFLRSNDLSIGEAFSQYFEMKFFGLLAGSDASGS